MPIAEPTIERRLEAFKATAKEAGVKLTHQRLEIFREIASSQDHPNAETLFRTVQPRLPTVSLDTVYRTLWLLDELGLITTLGTRRDSVRFDPNLDPHHHYVCVQCGLTRDFESDALDRLEVPAAVGEFGRVLDARVEVRGICESCTKQGADGAPARGARRGPKAPKAT